MTGRLVYGVNGGFGELAATFLGSCLVVGWAGGIVRGKFWFISLYTPCTAQSRFVMFFMLLEFCYHMYLPLCIFN